MHDSNLVIIVSLSDVETAPFQNGSQTAGSTARNNAMRSSLGALFLYCAERMPLGRKLLLSRFGPGLRS
jgi:hypothetical protein